MWETANSSISNQGEEYSRWEGRKWWRLSFVQDACEVLSDPVVFEQRPEGNVEGTVQVSEGRRARLRRAKAKAWAGSWHVHAKGAPMAGARQERLSRAGVPMEHQGRHWLRCLLQALRGAWSCLACHPLCNLHSWDIPAELGLLPPSVLFPSMALTPKVGGVTCLSLWWSRREKARKPLSGWWSVLFWFLREMSFFYYGKIEWHKTTILVANPNPNPNYHLSCTSLMASDTVGWLE